MKVCVLADEVFGDYSPEPYLKNYEWKMYNVQRPALEFIRDILARESYDVFLNLCDGMADEDRPGLDVVQALETLGIPFTGPDSGFYSPSRDQMQAVAHEIGIGFARGMTVNQGEDIKQAVKRAGYRYPLMVKHYESYGSVGMTRDSRVENSDQLQFQFDALCASFGGARVEEFIEGREFTVLIVDNPDDLSRPYLHQPLEIIFPVGETFKHWKLKFDDDLDMDLETVSEPVLAERLKDMVEKMYLALGGTSYGRADIRMDADGNLYMLELNPGPSILNSTVEMTSADFMVVEDPDGADGFLDRIFRSALVRFHNKVALAH